MLKRSKRRKVAEKDEDDSDLYDDEVDTFHKQKEKILLDNIQAEDKSEEEEVLPVVDDSDSDDEEIATYKHQLRQLKRVRLKKKMDSDLEDGDQEDDLPDSKAWGLKRSWFQGGDVRDNKIVLSGSEDEAGVAALEEKESLAIQRRLAAQLNEDDFGITEFVQSGKILSDKKMKELTVIKPDLTQMSRKEELDILKKEHPEFLPLVADFRAKMIEVQETVIPLMELVKSNSIQGLEADYVRCKFHIYMSYLMNGSFYMSLIAKRTPVRDHPVVKRLVQFRNLAKLLEPLEKQVSFQVPKVLAAAKRGVPVIISHQTSSPLKIKKHKITSDENIEKAFSNSDSEHEDKETAEKRAITYQIAKNKGLTPHKKKDLRNPRVKHRVKYRRAKIRRKGQVRDYKPQGYYSGELTGIRAGVVRSVKMK